MMAAGSDAPNARYLRELLRLLALQASSGRGRHSRTEVVNGWVRTQRSASQIPNHRVLARSYVLVRVHRARGRLTDSSMVGPKWISNPWVVHLASFL